MTRGAWTKLLVKGKKPGAGKTGASSSTPKKRAAPPQLRGGNASRKPNKGKEKATEEVTSPSLHKKRKEKEVTSSSMATEKAHMSFWDLHNAVAASQVKIGVLEEELAKEKTRKEFHRALIKVAKKAAGAHFF